MIDSLGHHLVYGKLSDYLTGEELVDTDDERFRQDLSRMMVEKLGYAKGELEPRRYIDTLFSSQFVRSTIELAVRLQGRIFMTIRYAPGSLVSRERAAIAAARVLEKEYQIPLTVVTNFRDAELLDVGNGKVLATGMEAIPSRSRALEMLPELTFSDPPRDERRERELRILNVFDLEICCTNR